jgi:hypothetical protein
MIKRLITATLFICAAALAPSFSEAGQPAQLMAGDPSGAHVSFAFGAKDLRIETHQVGNPGAKLSIWVDQSGKRLFSRFLTADDCKFGDDGARCRLVFPEHSLDYSRFVVAFRRGRTAHVEVENAAVMQMSKNISLKVPSREWLKLESGVISSL